MNKDVNIDANIQVLPIELQYEILKFLPICDNNCKYHTTYQTCIAKLRIRFNTLREIISFAIEHQLPLANRLVSSKYDISCFSRQ